MTRITTAQRIGAMATALAALAGTATLLFADVAFDRAPVTLDHVVTALTLAVALLAGHFAWPTLRAGLYIPGTGLAIAAVAALMLVVSASAGRKADVDAIKARYYAKIASDYAKAKADVDDARREYTDARAAERIECVKVGTQCDRKSARSRVAWARVELLERFADSMKPPADTGGATRAFARAIAALPGVTLDEREIERRLASILPYLLAIAFEIAFLSATHVVFSGIGTIPRQGRQQLPETIAGASPPPHPARLPARSAPRDVRTSHLQAGNRFRAEEIAALRAAFAGNDGPLDNTTLAARMSVTEGEASKRVSAAVAAGIVTRNRIGRRVAIALR